MKTFLELTYIAICLKVLDDGPFFSGKASRQGRAIFFWKYRRAEWAKTKAYIFFYKTLTNSFFKSYTAIAM